MRHFFKITFLIGFIAFSFIAASGQQLKIKRINTPNVNINGKLLKVGDSFNKQDVINWANDKQALIAQDGAGKMYRLSASVVKGQKGFSFEKLLGLQKSYMHLSSRDLGDEVEVGGEYIIEDSVEIPTSLDNEVDYVVELTYVDNDVVNTYRPALNETKTAAIVRNDIFCGEPRVLKLNMYIIPEGEEALLISNEITLIPLDIALLTEDCP